MFEHDWKELSEREELQKTKRRLPLILLIATLMVVLGGGGLLAWQLASQQSTSANGSSSVASPQATQGTQATDINPQDKGTPPDVATEVRQNVAQKLHLSVSQLQTKLQSAAPGAEIENLAMQQGISLDQWRSFVLGTYQAAYDHAVHAGKVTQQRANHDMQNIRSYPFTALDDWVALDCLGAS